MYHIFCELFISPRASFSRIMAFLKIFSFQSVVYSNGMHHDISFLSFLLFRSHAKASMVRFLISSLFPFEYLKCFSHKRLLAQD